jgi:uroporphyrinogen decarboxylase
MLLHLFVDLTSSLDANKLGEQGEYLIGLRPDPLSESFMITSRDRVLAALRHEEPDRVPIDLGSHASSTIAVLAYMKLRAHLNVAQDELPKMYNTWGQYCDVQEEVLDSLSCDIVPLHRAISSFSIFNDGDWKEWTLVDGSKCLVPAEFTPQQNKDGDWEWYEGDNMIARMPGEGKHGFTLFWAPMEGEPTKEKIDALFASENNNFISRIKTSDREVKYLQAEAKRLRESGNERAVLFQHGGTILENAQGIFGWDEIFVRCISDPDLVHYFLGGLTELHLETLKRTLDAAGDVVDVIQFGDDLGMQGAPLLDPEMYREIFLPYHKRLFTFVRENYPHIHVMLHCDGAVYELLPDMIEAGMQVFNPLQTDCAGMDPARIKREFGDQITFWGGGCDTHATLVYGTPDQICEDVRRRMQILAPGGGFVFNQIHNVLGDIPPRNVLAMIGAAQEFGSYPIAMEAPLAELESKYSDYWSEPFKALKAEAVH